MGIVTIFDKLFLARNPFVRKILNLLATDNLSLVAELQFVSHCWEKISISRTLTSLAFLKSDNCLEKAMKQAAKK